MLPYIVKTDSKGRSFSVSIEKNVGQFKHKTNISHYSHKIVEMLQHQNKQLQKQQQIHKEPKSVLIVQINNIDTFKNEIMDHIKYQQFLKYKDFLSLKQIDQFFSYITNFIVTNNSSGYESHSCTFQLNNKQFDLEIADSKTIFEVIQEFIMKQIKKEYCYIYGGDFQLIHKSPFRQVLYLCNDKIIKVNEQEKRFFRFRTQIQSTQLEHSTEEYIMDQKLQQIGMHKKNKEIKQYLQKHSLQDQIKLNSKNKSKELQIKKMFNSPREKKSENNLELPQICDQIFDRFKIVFQIQEIDIDKEIFSQFLLLCELTLHYSRNSALQSQISRLQDDKEKMRLLTTKVLYFEFKVLKNMNENLQVLNTGTIQALLKFINQDINNSEMLTRIYWNGFQRFKMYYIDRNWNVSDCRYFLLLLNEESPLTVQNILQMPLREIQKMILTISEELLQQIVFTVIYSK